MKKPDLKLKGYTVTRVSDKQPVDQAKEVNFDDIDETTLVEAEDRFLNIYSLASDLGKAKLAGDTTLLGVTVNPKSERVNLTINGFIIHDDGTLIFEDAGTHWYDLPVEAANSLVDKYKAVVEYVESQ